MKNRINANHVLKYSVHIDFTITPDATEIYRIIFVYKHKINIKQRRVTKNKFVINGLMIYSIHKFLSPSGDVVYT
jgi:hypothetical protein